MSAPDEAAPLAEDLPVFEAPWQAKAFALTVHLHARGAFAWSDWTAALAAERAREPEGGYYTAWLRALEALLARPGLAPPETVDATAARWRLAARATPHGRPIRLENAGP